MKQQKFKRHRFFHFTTHIIHPKWFEMSSGRNWLDFLRSLQKVQKTRFDEELVWHSGVQMSNHVHLLFSTQSYNEHSVILDLEKAMMFELGVRTPIFQRPLPCEPLEHIEHLRSAYKYIYRNPVEVGLVKKVEDYRYSSLHLLLGKEQPTHSHPFLDPLQLVQNLPNRLKWLNSQAPYAQYSFDFDGDLSLGF